MYWDYIDMLVLKSSLTVAALKDKFDHLNHLNNIKLHSSKQACRCTMTWEAKGVNFEARKSVTDETRQRLTDWPSVRPAETVPPSAATDYTCRRVARKPSYPRWTDERVNEGVMRYDDWARPVYCKHYLLGRTHLGSCRCLTCVNWGIADLFWIDIPIPLT